MKPSFKEYLINEARYHDWREATATDFEPGKPVRANNITRGMILQITYLGRWDSYVEVLGFTANTHKYGEGGVKYNSAKEMYKANNVTNLTDLEDSDSDQEYGFHHYMVVRDLTDDVIKNSDNDTYKLYIYNGRWVVGSSAEKVSFREAKYVPRARVTEARYHNSVLQVETFDDPHDIDDRELDIANETKRLVSGKELGFIEGMPQHYGYFGVFYEEKPLRSQVLPKVEKILKEMHPDPNAVSFADCIVDGGSVFYEGRQRRGEAKLYCDDADNIDHGYRY